MKNTFLLVLVLITQISFAQQDSSLPLIPRPNEITLQKGCFKLSETTQYYLEDKSLLKELDFFIAYIKKNNGFTISETKNPKQKNIIKVLKRKSKENSEAYGLTILQDQISIKGDSNGVFYACQTLIQLVNARRSNAVDLACLIVNDAPVYRWRGMHLDVCRHFFSVSFVKKYIDILALYKFNTFHWHLTDDQGWRIQIKKYPKLTEIGGWRKGTMVGKYDDHMYDTIRYGGFYTQAEIKEVVAYAQQKHITIVPEIEMPGHAVAAISAYPYLSCKGKQIDVERGWGVFEDVFCPKDSTFKFLEDVLSEVLELFPGKYIHIGGDECPKENWKKCEHCQMLIKKEHLKDENGLQSYFINRIEKFVNSKGRQIIGWDEILEGGLAPNASVMSWRGTEGGIAAARQKHYAVMSPGKPCYFDHYQSREILYEPLSIGGYNPIDSVYAYNPMPGVLDTAERNYILGAQANVWTEYILNEKHLEYMLVPRMCALSEVLWTEKSNKNYPDFIKRLKQHTKLFDQLQVNYAKHFLTQK
ncbi:beta-N-acetylglucosaminidase [Sphingobacteriaceae bacterium]|nr:beta-N-acetylglucosaminidase [Sphingobacteriaceae bacterium]